MKNIYYGSHFSDLAQNGQNHGTKYWRNLMFSYIYIKLPLKDQQKSNDKPNLNLAKISKFKFI